MTTTDTATDKLEVASTHTQDARARATEVSDHAQDAAKDVTATAVDRAHQVKDETVRQARNLASDAGDQLASQASGQTQRISANLRDLGHELRQMADAGSGGTATELAHQAAERAQQAAGYLDGREPGQILDDLRSLARRRPGAFLAGAAVLGLVAGRVGRGVKDAPSSTAAGTANPYPTEPPLAAPPSERGYDAQPNFLGAEHPADFSSQDFQTDLIEPDPYGVRR